MPTLTRPEGNRPEDLNLSRRALAGLALAGYAAYAVSAEAQPVKTDEEGLTTETVSLPAADRGIPAYLARPATPGPHPAIVVVSEIFGVHEYIRDTCRRLAKLGYAALAPDFFVRHGDPSGLTDFEEIRKIVAAASQAQVRGDLAAGVTYLRGQPFVDAERLGITGFCWGGAVTWLACAQAPEFKAGVAWYGRLSAPQSGASPGDEDRIWPIDVAAELKAPVLGLYAGKDQGIPLESVDAMRRALAEAGKTDSEIIVYPDAQHGFHADYRAAYDAQAAADGWARMREHFRKHGVAPAGGG